MKFHWKASLTCCLAVFIMTGCATKPVISGDSSIQPKDLTYPKIGTQSSTKTGGVVHLRANYTSSFSHSLTQPVRIGFMLGTVEVSTTDALVQTTLSDETAYCTTAKTYRDPLAGPTAITCFIEGTKGFFTKIKAAPGAVWFSKDLPSPIPYQSREVPTHNSGRPLKRELIFDGSKENVAFFSERIYENSLTTADRIKPHVVRINGRPSLIDLSGAKLTIHEITENSLNFTLEKAWD